MRKTVFMLLLFLLFINSTRALTTTSEAVVLMDQDSGRILYSKNKDKQKPIASITKIMTAVLAIESNQLDDIVTIDNSILKAYGSNIYIQIGEEISLRDLVYGLMLRSGNDAALAISNYLSFSEGDFVKKMNDKARFLGMRRTNFVNSHGLDEESSNISTAHDMAILTAYANKLDEYKKIVATKKYLAKTNYKTYVWHNKNKLLSMYKYTTGGKTGFTDKAKRTLVSSAYKKGMNLIVVSLNDYDDWTTHQNLHEHGFNNYKQYLVLNKNNISLESDFYKERLYIKNNYYYPLLEREKADISLKAKITRFRGYKNEDKVGELEVYFKGKLVHTEDIYIEVKKEKMITPINLWYKIRGWLGL
jgi:serine-type D-Ala-D-Ala carboxypeptidase (penicillin-binding protein 5/6)